MHIDVREADECAAGIEAFNFDGGMRAWQQAGGAVIRIDGSSGQVI